MTPALRHPAIGSSGWCCEKKPIHNSAFRLKAAHYPTHSIWWSLRPSPAAIRWRFPYCPSRSPARPLSDEKISPDHFAFRPCAAGLGHRVALLRFVLGGIAFRERGVRKIVATRRLRRTGPASDGTEGATGANE